jgi:large subunit ribosomal protein L3
MAGHMGVEVVTTQNLRVVAIDEAENLILVEGSVPGYKGNWVYITDAVKKALPKEAPMPAGFKSSNAPAQEQPVAESTAPEAPSADAPAAEEAKSE